LESYREVMRSKDIVELSNLCMHIFWIISRVLLLKLEI